MAGSRPKLDFIMLDGRNALVFNEANTVYILARIREATGEPARRAAIYAEMAKRFHIDPDKINAAVIRYADRLNRERRRNATDRDRKAPGVPDRREERVLMAELCRQVGHRYVAISLSHRRGCRECERCGKHESRYNI